MQTVLIVAAVLNIATGIAHSVLGEILIFRHLRSGGFVPRMAAPPLKERHIRILWASWHLATVLGFALAALLLHIALDHDAHLLSDKVLTMTAWANLGGALLVLVGTKGKHPGWIALSIVSGLIWFAANAQA